MHIKTTTRYHLTPVRVEDTKKTGNDQHGKGCVEEGILVTLGDPDVYGKQYGDFSRK